MDCKNCKSELSPENNYCSECGAKIIRERISIKSLLLNVIVSLGWDSNFFVTLRELVSKPQIVFKEYIKGTRKKYANPFTFYAISLAISLFVFNQYSEQLIQMSTLQNLEQVGNKEEVSLPDNTSESPGLKAMGFKSHEELGKSIITFQMKYYNLVSFLFLPLSAFLGFLVFRKPYNYGEHLVINTYIHSLATFLGAILFVFSLLVKVNMFFYSPFITFLYYSYAYKKLYALSFGRIVLKMLKFIGLLLSGFIMSVIIGTIIIILK